jgi:hypothetical protein
MGQQARDAHGGGGFAAAGFADEPQHLAAVEAERDAVDRADGLPFGLEPDVEVCDFEKHGDFVFAHGLHGLHGLGLSTDGLRFPTSDF